MLNTKEAIATVAVKDLKTAAVFYEGALGFEKVAVVDEELITYRSGNSVFNVYRSKYAGSNQANCPKSNSVSVRSRHSSGMRMADGAGVFISTIV